MAERVKVIRWEDPPRTQSYGGGPSGSRFDGLAEVLRDEPNRWAVIYQGSRGTASGMAGKIKHGAMKAFRPVGVFEATVRTDGQTSTVYARYVGGDGR